MDVNETSTNRWAVRGFKDDPVSSEVLERVLSDAVWSLSGSNAQPWNNYLEDWLRAEQQLAHHYA